MNPNLLAFGLIEYVVFLLSTTCHEAAHALVAKMGGDSTAFEGGQVSLNPIPHMRRELFGMVILPLVGILTGTGLIGYASAPYDPAWSIRHPKRSGLMSLAGPGANFLLAILAAAIMAIGLSMGTFQPQTGAGDGLATAASSDLMAGVATILSVFFTLNLLLGCFNLAADPLRSMASVCSVFSPIPRGSCGFRNCACNCAGHGCWRVFFWHRGCLGTCTIRCSKKVSG